MSVRIDQRTRRKSSSVCWFDQILLTVNEKNSQHCEGPNRFYHASLCNDEISPDCSIFNTSDKTFYYLYITVCPALITHRSKTMGQYELQGIFE